MKRCTLAFSLLLAAGGCAAVDGNFMGGQQPARHVSKEPSRPLVWAPMASHPPAAPAEEVPELDFGEEWVPGYYEPVAGAWVWHQGEIRDQKHGYQVVPASYREQSGTVYFTPPSYTKSK